MQRIKLYSQISTSLSALSNEKLKQILADGKPMHEGIGGKSALISINDTPVFVKKVPLTDVEQLPQHFMSTANIFDLPLSYGSVAKKISDSKRSYPGRVYAANP